MVWSVSSPTGRVPERRQVPDRRRSYIPNYQPERRITPDRRAPHGWLCFETGSERKCLRPAPPGWKYLPKEEIEALCEQAEPVPGFG